MGLSDHQRDIILKLGSPTPGDDLIDQDAIADLMLLDFVFINPGTGKPILTESGWAIYDEMLEGEGGETAQDSCRATAHASLFGLPPRPPPATSTSGHSADNRPGLQRADIRLISPFVAGHPDNFSEFL